MRKDLTDITVIMDRSGSMASCREDAEGGINTLIEDQKKQAGEAVFSLVQFDTEYEFVNKATPIKDVAKVTLTPRGSTALLDAIGKAIVETGERLKATAEADRPGLVVVAIVTDGQENASREYSKAMIKEMIEHQQSAYKWQFTFLGANQDAFAEAGGLGIAAHTTANFAPSNSAVAYASVSANIGRMRSASIRGQSVNSSYTESERSAMKRQKGDRKPQ